MKEKHFNPFCDYQAEYLTPKAAGSINNAFVAIPDFGNLPSGRDASDWNDLVRMKGVGAAKVQIMVGTLF